MVKFRKALMLIAMLGLLLAGIRIAIPKSEIGQPDEKPTASLIAVEVVRIHEVDHWDTKVNLTGILKPKRRSELAFERLGRVDSIWADQGSYVEKGEMIAELNTELLESQMKKLEADRDAARAVLEELIAGPRKETIEAAKASVVELEAQVHLARQSLERRRRLAHSEAISREDLEQAEATLQRTEAARIGAQKSLEDLMLGTRKEKIETQKATLVALEEMINAIGIEIAHSAILAPYDGTVVQRGIHEGAVAQPGVPVFVMIEDRSLEAQFGVPAQYFDELRVGESVTLNVRDQNVEAVIRSINPLIDDETRTMKIIAKLDPSTSAKVVAGEVVSLQLNRRQDVTGYWLPTSAILQANRGLWECFVVEGGGGLDKGCVATRVVEVLHAETDRVLVRGTLSPGELVVTSAVGRLVSGQQVTIPDLETLASHRAITE